MDMINIIKHYAASKTVCIENATDNKELNEKLKEDGCAVIPDFITKDLCKTLINRSIEIFKTHPNNTKYESNGSDARIYGIDRIDRIFELKSETKKIDDWAKKFYRSNDLKYFQMLGHIQYKNDNIGSGGGWHRDSPFAHQFKFILYLNDVNELNGPFEYIMGTHKERKIIEYSKEINAKLNRYRFSDNEVDSILKKFTKTKTATITGKAGTLLIADVKGLHRGKPLVSGERWATTRYYFKNTIPNHLLK